ncbi:sensor histidine kinase [Bradyrhizobium sp. SSBR45G]|uniref:Hpt domain-containing protein n=1 Tax=unclassified Bradyrhizobium TaxID=2631580 RepID=UPI0023429550|nr:MULTISPECIES: Hpt domain-containing protein [unclassified Bradyrhizobium]GLH76182.1 sensor histidine kinase [Bradyrhizobium sp. SSBR45G]GLH83334.1 sensor histidine kinase [Bradyrhizobium sp. SSBR45R]
MTDLVQFDESVYQILISELGEEDALEVLRTFLDDTSSKFKQLPAKFENRLEMKREAHSMKSSSATFGFAALSRLSRELELGSATMEPAQMLEMVHKMETSFEQALLFAEANLLKRGAAAA